MGKKKQKEQEEAKEKEDANKALEEIRPILDKYNVTLFASIQRKVSSDEAVVSIIRKPKEVKPETPEPQVPTEPAKP